MAPTPAPKPTVRQAGDGPSVPSGWLTAAELAVKVGTSERRIRQSLAGQGRTLGGGRRRLYFSPEDYAALVASAEQRPDQGPAAPQVGGGTIRSLPAGAMQNLASQALADVEDLRLELAIRERTADLGAQLQLEREHRRMAEEQLGRLKEHLAQCYRLLAEANGITL